ncbi:MAG: DUF1285 domain-containing protein [Alphaproteobacteria bacterium]
MSQTGKKPRQQGGKSPAGPVLRGLEASRTKHQGPAPVHLWNPPFCGDLDLRIARDGTWHYLGSPIGRARLVKLFARVLRHDNDGKFYLVTPVEKIGITVDDAPFLAGEMVVAGAGKDQKIEFVTNVGDRVLADGDHPLRFTTQAGTGGLKPYVLVRGRLEALVARPVMFDLVELAVEGEGGLGVWSGGAFFPMVGPVAPGQS